MKVCPVCGAVAFDDAVMCFGCLHRFGEEGLGVDASEGGEMDGHVAAQAAATVAVAPEFLIRFRPTPGDDGCLTWSCAVELEKSAPVPG